jgi:hypothetical protein
MTIFEIMKNSKSQPQNLLLQFFHENCQFFRVFEITGTGGFSILRIFKEPEPVVL